jgi:death-on-curing protein
MAGAYAFHVCQNHPFIDGNKRVALASSLVFLDINGYTFNCKDEEVYNEIMNVAKGEVKKEELLKYYEKYSKKT